MAQFRAHVDVVRPADLGEPDLAAWREVQRSDPALANPFLAPEFALAVGAARAGTRVAVRRRAAGPDGFLAFERAPHGVGRRVGDHLADHQAVVCAPEDPWDVVDLLAPAGLHSVRLENVPVERLPASATGVVRYPSPVIDLRQGYEAYRDGRREVSRSMLPTVRRKERKLAREVGPLRFEFDAHDPAALRTVMRWKSGQYARLGEWDRFAAPDAVGIVDALADSRAPGCAGTLSLLWAGDELAAAHFGLRSENVLTSWFPTFNPELARYSPGLLLHLLMAEDAARRGMSLFDLGRGEHGYKNLLKTGELTLARASVFARAPGGLAHRLASAPMDGARILAARSPVARSALVAVRDRLVSATGRPRPPAGQPRPPAYVLGGHEAGLAVIRSLGRAGIPVVAVTSSDHEHARHSRHADATVQAPDPADAPRAYADLLLDLAERRGEGVLVPTTDEALEAVAAHRDELARRHLVACPSAKVASVFLDKRLTGEAAAEAGVASPRTATPADAAELAGLERELVFPCLVKPRESYRYNRAFGVKMTRVHDRAELREAWHRADAEGISTLVQELIPGPETGGVNYNVYLVDGEPVVEFTSRKVRLAPRDFGYPCAVVSAPVPEVVEPGRAIVREMGIEGFANVEFKRDARTGRYTLMEVNGRPNMSGELAVRCGVDFPLMTYRHLVDGIVPTAREWTSGVHWINEYTDPRGVLARWRGGELSLPAGLAPYASRHVFASFALDDPGPFLARAAGRMPALARVLPG